MVITKNIKNNISLNQQTSNSKLTFNTLSTSQTFSTSSNSQITSIKQHQKCSCFSKISSFQKLLSTLKTTPKPNQLSLFFQLLNFLSPKLHPLQFDSDSLLVKNQNKQLVKKYKAKKQQYFCATCLCQAQSQLIKQINNLTCHMTQFLQNNSVQSQSITFQYEPTNQNNNISQPNSFNKANHISPPLTDTLLVPLCQQFSSCDQSSLPIQHVIQQKLTSFSYYFDEDEYPSPMIENLPEFPNSWILTTLYKHSAFDDYIYSQIVPTLAKKIVNEKIEINEQTISHWTQLSLYQQFPLFQQQIEEQKLNESLTPHIPLHYILEALWVCEAVNGTCLRQVEQELHPIVQNLITQDPSRPINMQLIQSVIDSIVN